MKRTLFILGLAMLLVAALAAPAALAGPPVKCATIQGGTITDSGGNPLSVGYDEFGYNYQGRMFNGVYDAFDRVIGNDASDFADDHLIMKWSNDWLSNQDCDDDGLLDRGSAAPYGTSQGWLTNHLEGDYDSDGNGTQDAHYSYFVKIVWTGPGSPLWGEYTVVQEVYNDPVGGFGGLLSKEGAPGFGLNCHWTC